MFNTINDLMNSSALINKASQQIANVRRMLDSQKEFIAAGDANLREIEGRTFSTPAPAHVILPFNTKTMSHAI